MFFFECNNYLIISHFSGDLFHDNNPSRDTRIRVMRTLRKFTLEGSPTELEFVSRPENLFGHSAFKCVNFEDENLCVSVPIFSIHGNHDDLSGAVSIFYYSIICLLMCVYRVLLRWMFFTRLAC